MDKQPGGGGDPIHKLKKNEDYIITGIDYHSKSQVFSRDDKGPDSLISYWKSIVSGEGIPTQKEEQIDYFLLQMDTVNLQGYPLDKITKDKNYVEKSIGIDFDNAKNNPVRFKEKLLERVYAHCLVKVFEKKEVISGGNEEEISLAKSVRSHPYDLNKRQIQQVLSIVDKRYPDQMFNLGLSVQWGHENTDDEAIDTRISFVVNGITDYGSTTELCYTSVDEKQAMPIYVPSVVVGGDIKKVSSFNDQVMKGEYSEASKSSLVYNAITQMKTQIDLFYNIALQQQTNLSSRQAPLGEYEKMKFMFVKDKLHETVSSYSSMKNVIDQIFEANAPSIQNAKTDIIHEKIMSICKEIAKRNNITLGIEG